MFQGICRKESYPDAFFLISNAYRVFYIVTTKYLGLLLDYFQTVVNTYDVVIPQGNTLFLMSLVVATFLP